MRCVVVDSVQRVQNQFRAALELRTSTTFEMSLSLGSILYVLLLIINAIAILSEDRFLARSACRRPQFARSKLRSRLER